MQARELRLERAIWLAMVGEEEGRAPGLGRRIRQAQAGLLEIRKARAVARAPGAELFRGARDDRQHSRFAQAQARVAGSE